MEVLLQPKTQADDTLDDVVFLHRATPGECTDSFGWHCAFNADLPEAIISRARYISNCRAQGEEIMALDADAERLQRSECVHFLQTRVLLTLPSQPASGGMSWSRHL